MIELVASLFGSMGFAVLFRIRGLRIALAGVGGMLGWAVYLLVTRRGLSVVLAYLLAASFVTLYSELWARQQRVPATTFLIAGIIPLVPGRSLYLTMRHAVNTQFDAFAAQGIQTVAVAAAIAAGVMAATSLVRMTGPHPARDPETHDGRDRIRR